MALRHFFTLVEELCVRFITAKKYFYFLTQIILCECLLTKHVQCAHGCMYSVNMGACTVWIWVHVQCTYGCMYSVHIGACTVCIKVHVQCAYVCMYSVYMRAYGCLRVSIQKQTTVNTWLHNTANKVNARCWLVYNSIYFLLKRIYWKIYNLNSWNSALSTSLAWSRGSQAFCQARCKCTIVNIIK